MFKKKESQMFLRIRIQSNYFKQLEMKFLIRSPSRFSMEVIVLNIDSIFSFFYSY